MIRVAIDTSSLNKANRYRGVGKYFSKLAEALKKTQKVDLVLDKADLIHYPFFDFFFLTLPLLKKNKTIVTVHDCTPLVFPRFFPPGIKGKIKFQIQKYSLKRVSSVITDSIASKNDIVKYLSIPENKIYPIYLAADECYKKISINSQEKEKFLKKYGLKNNFVLYVGDVNYNKNLPFLLQAFSQADIESDLVFVGKAFEDQSLPEVKKLFNKVKELKIEDKVRFIGFVDDQDLVWFYNLALVYCQPSLYEGFGLPVLEAMACGCPVITSNVSSLPEIAGEAAVLIDPENANQLTQAIKKIFDDNKFKEMLIEKGFDQIKKFSWEKTAQQTIDVYEKVLEK